MIAVTPFETVTLRTDLGNELKVNGQRLKLYLRGILNDNSPRLKDIERIVEKREICSNVKLKT